MEAELFHHIGIAPSLQKLFLSWGERRRQTTRHVAFAEGRAETIKMGDAIARQILKFYVWIERGERHKITDGADDHFFYTKGRSRSGKLCEAFDQFHLGSSLCEMKRRLQSAMEPIAARLLRPRQPILSRDSGCLGNFAVGARQRIVTDALAPEPPERIIDAGRIINGVSGPLLAHQ